VILNGRACPGDTANVRLSTNGYTANFTSANVGTGIGVTASGLTFDRQRSGQLHANAAGWADGEHYASDVNSERQQ